MTEFEVRNTVELYRSMLESERNQRRRAMLSELLVEEQRKLVDFESGSRIVPMVGRWRRN